MASDTNYNARNGEDKAEKPDATGGNGGNANTRGNGGGRPNINNLGFADWSLPADLMQMLQRQGEPNEELFLNFIKAALHNSADEDIIIKACLDQKPPYGGSIYKHVQATGGEDYIKRTIVSVIN